MESLPLEEQERRRQSIEIGLTIPKYAIEEKKKSYRVKGQDAGWQSHYARKPLIKYLDG